MASERVLSLANKPVDLNVTMNINRFADDYLREHLDRDSRTLFYKQLYNALLRSDAVILQALLTEYPEMPIELDFLWGVAIELQCEFYNRLATTPECVELLLQRASQSFKLEMLHFTLTGQNQIARLIIESGIEIDGESVIMASLCQRQDLLALHITLSTDSEYLCMLARAALRKSAIGPDALALIIQNGFDVRELWSSQYGVDLSVIRWLGYYSLSALDQRKMFTDLIEPKLALLVLSGVCSVGDLSRDSLSKTLVQWQQIAPRYLCPSQDGIVAYLKAQAADLVRRFGADVCIALQSLDLPALVTCQILQAHCSRWPLIPFHNYWNLAVAVKHFQRPEHDKKRRRT